MVFSQCCVLGHDGEQLFLPGVIMSQIKDWLFSCFLVTILKNNVTAEPKAFPVIIVQHIVAQLT